LAPGPAVFKKLKIMIMSYEQFRKKSAANDLSR
jgi:hypothetical protein